MPNVEEKSPTITLTRYSLFFEGEDQGVGFMIGLDDLGLSPKTSQGLIQPFNAHLQLPPYQTFTLTPGEQTAAYFTEEGMAFFEENINRIVRIVRKKGNGFTIEQSQLTLGESDPLILYQDEYQVIVRKLMTAEEMAMAVCDLAL